MCRLLATVGPWQTDALRELIATFGALARDGRVPPGAAPGHEDGWGFAAWHGDACTLHLRAPEPATGSSAFAEAIGHLAVDRPDLLIGHLRKASQGKRALENTHPFVDESWGFCHNGSLGDTSALGLSPAGRGLLAGYTDSEVVFRLFLERMAGVSPEGVRSVLGGMVRDVRKACPTYTSLNMLIGNGRTLWAVREVNEEHPAVRAGNLAEEYYTLFVGTRTDGTDGLCIASEALPIKGLSWEALPNHTMFECTSVPGTARPRQTRMPL